MHTMEIQKLKDKESPVYPHNPSYVYLPAISTSGAHTYLSSPMIASYRPESQPRLISNHNLPPIKDLPPRFYNPSGYSFPDEDSLSRETFQESLARIPPFSAISHSHDLDALQSGDMYDPHPLHARMLPVESHSLAEHPNRKRKRELSDSGTVDEKSTKKPSQVIDARLKTLEDSMSCDDEEGYLILSSTRNLTPRYKILRLLGQGTFGKVVEAFDRTTKQHVAIKIIKSIQKYREASKMEIKTLQTLEKHDPDCTKNHICMVFELLSISIFDFLKANRFIPFPLSQIRSFARQLLTSVAFMHDLKLIHTDLKPENIMLLHDGYRELEKRGTQKKAPRELLDTRIKLIDFGSTISESDYHSSVVSTRHYRAPEIILGIPWSFPCDVWSIGCVLVEFFTGAAIFQTHEKYVFLEISRDSLEHLAMMEVVLGKIPSDMIQKASTQASSFFVKGQLNFPNLTTDRKSRRFVRRLKTLKELVNPHDPMTEEFYDLIRQMLRYDTTQRITAQEALGHAFFLDL